MLFKKTGKTLKLLKTWRTEYLNQKLVPARGDQMYLSYLMFRDKNVRYAVLPNEYRFNSDNPQSVSGEIKIITSLVSDKDPEGKYSLEKLNQTYNPTGIYERIIYTKLIGGSRWKKKVTFLPYRLFTFVIWKSKKTSLLSKLTKLLS